MVGSRPTARVHVVTSCARKDGIRLEAGLVCHGDTIGQSWFADRPNAFSGPSRRPKIVHLAAVTGLEHCEPLRPGNHPRRRSNNYGDRKNI